MKKILFLFLLLPAISFAQVAKNNGDNGVSVAADSRYVNITGDVMTGPLQTTSLTASSVTVTGNAQVNGNFSAGITNGVAQSISVNASAQPLIVWKLGNVDKYSIDYASVNGLQIYSNTLSNYVMRMSPTGEITIPGSAFSVGGSTLVVANGKVWIGANAAESIFNVAGAANVVTGNYSQIARFSAIDGASSFGLGLGYNTSSSNTIVASRSTSNKGFEFWTYNGAAWDSRLALLANGNVGIGTTSPSAKLQVSSGTIHLDGSGSPTVGKALCLKANGDMGYCGDTPTGGACTCN